MFWLNGLTALMFICFGTVFGISLFIKARKINAKTLKYMGLNIIFASWCYSGYVIDFLSVLLIGENFDNTYGEIGIISGIWLAIALIFAVYVGSELLFPHYKIKITIIYVLIGVAYEYFLIYDTNSVLGFIYPSSRFLLINFYVRFLSPLGFIVIFYYLSLFLFMVLGFLYKSLKSKGIIRKKFLYLTLAELFILISSFPELMPISSIYFLLTRPMLIIVPILVYFGFKKDVNFKNENLIVEKKLFRLVNSPINEFKSSFLRRASHELKTPLIPIKGHLNFLLNGYSGELDADVKNRLKEMVDAYEKLELLIQNFLLSLELEGDKLELSRKRINLSQLIRKQVANCEKLIELRDHELILDLEKELHVYLDKNLINQVIQNLLINAIKFTPFEGRIKVSMEAHPLYVKVSVKDNGIGITEDEKEFLFKKFGKIERYGQGWEIITDGAGLGLFICKKIIRAHGGTIGVYSEGRNEGSTFNLKLPRKT